MEQTFIVAVDDGDCRYEYPLTLKNGDDVSIYDIYKKLCEAYNVEPKGGIYCPSKAKAVKQILEIP